MSTFSSVFADLIDKFGTPVTEETTKDNYSVNETFCEDNCDNSKIDFNLIFATRDIFNPNNEQQQQEQGNAGNVEVDIEGVNDKNEVSSEEIGGIIARELETVYI